VIVSDVTNRCSFERTPTWAAAFQNTAATEAVTKDEVRTKLTTGNKCDVDGRSLSYPSFTTENAQNGRETSNPIRLFSMFVVVPCGFGIPISSSP
jgi:hypothetical protein